MPLLVKGDVRRLTLTSGEEIQLPSAFGMVHDPDGIVMDRCTVLVLLYTHVAHGELPITHAERKAAEKYFGNDYEAVRVLVDFPTPLWILAGNVRAIEYARKGQRRGRRRHLFKGEATRLFAHRTLRAFKLVLPDGCVLDARGFVDP